MPRFPIEYAIEVHKNDGSPMELAAGHRPRLIVGPPPEFDGSDVWWSPEHLLVSALASCMTATFYAAAAHATLRIGAYRCRARHPRPGRRRYRLCVDAARGRRHCRCG